MITTHMQRQMLRLYRLVCGEDYNPVPDNVEPLHRRMQAVCYLASLLFFFPDCGFSMNRGPYSPKIELALRMMDGYGGGLCRMNENNRSISPLAEVDVHEKILSPLFREQEITAGCLTEYLELAADLCYTSNRILPGGEAKDIVARVLVSRGELPFTTARASLLLERLRKAGMADVHVQ